MNLSMSAEVEHAYVGGGCFWGVEKAFLDLPGVIDTEVGYAGGDDEDYGEPTYKQVCSGETGHAEVVHVIFDPTEISYEDILVEFFRLHDPTQFNRQGPDYGTQYRSIVLYLDEEQKQIAEDVKRGVQLEHEKKVVTVVEPIGSFWRAEEYHQKYLLKNGGGCHI